MSKTHQKRDNEYTLCGIPLKFLNPEIVELPEEVTCKNCKGTMTNTSHTDTTEMREAIINLKVATQTGSNGREFCFNDEGINSVIELFTKELEKHKAEVDRSASLSLSHDCGQAVVEANINILLKLRSNIGLYENNGRDAQEAITDLLKELKAATDKEAL